MAKVSTLNHNLTLIYDIYCKKNEALMGSGFEIPKSKLFRGFYVILYDNKEEPLLFFKTSKGRAPYDNVFSNLLCLQSGKGNEEKNLLSKYLLEQKGEFVFSVEDYLKQEQDLLYGLELQEHHVSIRMGLQIEGNVCYEQPRGLEISSVVIDQDEDELLSIFNQTLDGLCEPATIEEVSGWTHAPGFNSDCYLLARRDGDTIGFIAIEVDDERKTSYLQEIGVIDDERCSGIGVALLASGVNKVIQCGVNWMGVGVLKGNKRAEIFFKNNGFSKIHRRKIMGKVK